MLEVSLGVDLTIADHCLQKKEKYTLGYVDGFVFVLISREVLKMRDHSLVFIYRNFQPGF